MIKSVAPKSKIAWTRRLGYKVAENLHWVLKLSGLGFTCLVVIVFGLKLLLTTLDPKLYQTTLENQLNQKINGTLNLGSVSWSLWPGINLKLGAGTLLNSQGQNLAQWDSGRINIKVWPLLSKKIILKDFSLTSLVLNYNSTQKLNPWQQLIKTNAKPSQFDFNLLEGPFGFNLNNATINVQSSNKNMDILDFSLKVENIFSDTPVNLALKGDITLKSANDNLKTAPILIDSTFQLTKDNSLKINTFALKSLIANPKITPTAINLAINLATKGDYQITKDTLSLDFIDLRINKSRLNASLKAKQLRSKPHFIFTLPKQKPMFGYILSAYLEETLTTRYIKSLLNTLETSGSIIITDELVGLLFDTFNIDKHQGKVDISYTFKPEALLANLNLAYFDLRPLFNPPKSIGYIKKVVKVVDEPKVFDFKLPINLLQNISLNAKIAISKLIAENLTIHSLTAQINSTEGIIDIKPITFRAFEGAVEAKARLNTNLKLPTLSIQQTSENLDIHTILQRTGKKSWINGLFQNTLNVTTQGLTFSSLLYNISGSLELSIKEAEIPGINLYKVAYSNIHLFKNALTPRELASFTQSAALNEKGTRISDFFATLTISPTQIESEKALLEINNKSATTRLHFNRTTSVLEFTSELNLNFNNSNLNQLKWPVTCRIEQWQLPKCGVVTR